MFDFEEAVRAARNDYPEEIQGFTFVDLSSPQARAILNRWYIDHPYIMNKTKRGFVLKTKIDDRLRKALVEDALSTSGRVIWHPDGSHEGLLLSNGPRELVDSGMSGPHDKQFTFDHELGHIVVPNGQGSIRELNEASEKNMSHEAEGAADCFATLRGLSRGTLSIDEIKAFSLRRATNTGTHLTTYALDHLLNDLPGLGYIALTSRAIKDVAQKYADAYTPSAAVLNHMTDNLKWECIQPNKTFFPKGVRDAFAKATGRALSAPRKSYVSVSKKQWLENLADIFQRAPHDSFEFYISAKILDAALNGGIPTFLDGNLTFETKGRKWNKLRKSFAPPIKK
jgi:hypothetical protein